MLTAFVLKQLGVDLVWAKATSESMRQILLKIGVNQVVRPEHDMGRRVAHLVRGKMIDYIEFDDGFAIVKTTPPKNILGVTLAASGVRTKYGVTIVGIKTPGNDFTYATPESIVTAGDLVIVSGERHRVERFSNEP
ncbi:MAG: TrkA C-terminal domain-containing protein [Nostocoides sp.]